MLRTSTARLLATSLAPRRALSTSRPAYIRIKKPEGAAPAAPTPTPTPTPAEKPAAVPEDVVAPPPFEPEVSRPSGAATTASASAGVDGKAADASAVPPSEPPAPGSPSTAPEPAAVDEIPDKPDLSKLPSLDIDPEEMVKIEQPKEEEGGKKRGPRRAPQYESSYERKRKFMARLGFASLAIGTVGAAYYVGSQEDANKPGDSDKSAWERFKGNFTELSDYFSKPAFTQLLPDPLPPPHQRPYTLLVDLEDMLVHSEWDRQHGWRTAKRPGVDYFLGYLSQFYEIVLFTSQPSYTAIPVAEKLDPLTLYLPYKLFREATRYEGGHVVKDLSFLNRDLSKVVLLDTKAEHASLQPDNAIIIKPWDGKRGDKGLVEMIPFLESIGIYAPADVRPVLKHYAGKDIPREYAKKEAEMKAAAIADWEKTHPNPNAGAGSGWLSGVFGGSSAAARPQQPMTYLEIKRGQAQRLYEEEQKYYNEHREEFLRMIEEDKQRQMAEYKGSLMGMFGSAPSPEQAAAAQANAATDAAAAAAPGAPKQ